MLVRPLKDTEEDAEAVRVLAETSFAGGPAAGAVPAEPGTAAQGGGALPAMPPPGAGNPARSRERVRHLVRTDPRGSWLAADAAGRPVGAAQSLVREGTWGLALLAVLPEAQGKGVGKALLERTLEYGRACLRGLICCPGDPVAARVYRRAGFELHPAMRLEGTVDPAPAAGPDGPVVPGSGTHRDLMDSVDRRLRGGAHGPDHEFLLRHCRLFVADDLAGSGYCYLREQGRVELLAATSRRLAARLLSAALLSLPEDVPATVPYVTAEQQWAVDVGLAAGLRPGNAGYVCLRGMRAPSPYIPSGGFL
ncbi:GNAT family N-acetyltransferase [Streptomyces ovatisporus]|uniref:GNAT family N-acetyltransferase n=1 Tax=Streptomyces ovatisporus TaxID=1128682 RepID=A0ABV9AE03_9ACTN